jgi:ribonuclease R
MVMEQKQQLLTYKPGTVVQGVYKAHGNRFGFVLTDKEHEDIYIGEGDSLNAVNNDTVEVKVSKSRTGRHSMEGRITSVLERANDTIVGTYEITKHGGEVVPVDERINMKVFIPEGEELGAVTGARVVVEVTRWPGKQTEAEGKVKEVIGYEGDKGLDIDIIIAKHKLPHVFSEELMKEANSLSHEVKPEDRTEDFRSLPMVTIDGPDSKDLDDAVYCEKKENGHYELGVHIADVSRYVKPGSLLDQEAYRRGNSVYLADRVIPMLPFQLSNDICSLNHDEDRYAMSCIVDVAPNGQVTTEKITPSIIRVKRRCTYPEINQAFAEGIASEDLKELLPMLENLRECAHILRKNRHDRGALDFDFPEYKVVLDEDGRPLRIVKRDRGEGERMIEDAMIAANEAVARYLSQFDMTSIYRVHEEPDSEKLDSLRRMVEILGLNIQIPSEPSPRDLQKLLEAVKGKEFASVIEVLTLRSLPQAQYSVNNVGHFGIASDCYTHFTSPIRRYSDLLVHRLLKQALYHMPKASVLKKQEEFLNRAAVHISETEQAATDAERDTTALKMTEYMIPFVGEPFDAKITGITSFGIFVGLDNGVEGLIHLSTMDDDDYIYNEDTLSITGRFTGKHYTLGMPVRVTLVKADKDRQEVDFIMGEIHSPLNLEKKTVRHKHSHRKGKKGKKDKKDKKGRKKKK